MKPRCLLLVVVLFLAGTSAAPGRVWTDLQGRQITAKFVRVHDDNVVLQRGTKVVTVPLAQLSEADREYVQQQSKAENGGPSALTPVKEPSDGEHSTQDAATSEPRTEKPAEPDDSKPKQAELRTWTDIRGNKMEARFVEAHGGLVVLLRDGNRRTYPLAGFTMEDQQYIRKELEARGESLQLPPSMPSPNSIAGMGPPRTPSLPNFPRMTPPTPSTRPSLPPSMTGPPKMPDHGAVVDSSPPKHHRPTFPTPSHRTSTPSAPEIPSYTPPTPEPMPQMEYTHEKRCSACNRVVPDSAKAGEHCPHCGAYWGYEEGPDGKRVSTAYRNGRVAGIGFVVALIVFFVRRALSGSG